MKEIKKKFNPSDVGPGNLVRNVRTDSIGLVLSYDDEVQFFKVLTGGDNGFEVKDWFRSNLEEVKYERATGISARHLS